MTGFAARYDLGTRNVSFDFFAWQTHAVILGATEIVFGVEGLKRRKEHERIVRPRYESIIKPGPALLGLPSHEGEGGQEVATHKLWGILGTKVVNFPRLKSVLSPGNARYTVTMRDALVHPERNSGKVWRDFARQIGAHVIEDYRHKPVHLHERMALYAGARMNFGVVNGPMGMLLLSAYPMMMWGCAIAEYAWKKHGVNRGEQLPWLLPGQSLVWEQPTLGDLMRAVDRIEAQC